MYFFKENSIFTRLRIKPVLFCSQQIFQLEKPCFNPYRMVITRENLPQVHSNTKKFKENANIDLGLHLVSIFCNFDPKYRKTNENTFAYHNNY